MMRQKNNRIKAVLVSPKNILIGNPRGNAEYILSLLKKIKNEKIYTGMPGVIVFPELCITGYSCGDLFNQKILITEAMKALLTVMNGNPLKEPLVFLGLPVYHEDRLYNCAAVIQGNNLIGFVPKTYLPNYNEFYEKRWFSSGKEIDNHRISVNGRMYPITENMIIEDGDIRIACEICEDLWMPIPPSSFHCLAGANVIVNLSASNETVGKNAYRRDVIRMHSAKNLCSYIYASASPDESTTDVVFSGHLLGADNGRVVLSSQGEIESVILDIYKSLNDRRKFSSFSQESKGLLAGREYLHHSAYIPRTDECEAVSLYPFVPGENLSRRAQEITDIQATGLAQRLKKTGIKKAVIGISGGMDSTLALLVTCRAFDILKLDKNGIIGITMPGFGTSSRTLKNSTELMDKLGIDAKKIDITDACIRHLSDIGHDISNHDITYENVQARERTQILMDIANMESGIVIGTGDLSELALGWCTYNGDHMSMYAVNASIPKTLVRHLIFQYRFQYPEISEVLDDILDTPVSPELLPPNSDGTIAQETENSIGSYILHDFTLYYMLRYGYEPGQIFEMARNRIAGTEDKITFSDEEIYKNMCIFYRRFFSQQFKRSCLPDGPKVGSVCLSPRGDWRMPSDADSVLWLQSLKKAYERHKGENK